MSHQKRKLEDAGNASKRKSRREDEADYDVIVIGGGPIGLSTAYNCAKANNPKKDGDARVLVLEQFVLFNQSGSSNDLVRMFRTMYTENFMADLALDAMKMWKELEKEVGEQLILMSGLLNFGDPDYTTGPEGNLVGPIDNLIRHGMEYRTMSVDEIEQEYPFRDLPRNFTGLQAPDNGCINLPLLLRSLHKLAVAHGTHIMQYAKVTKIIPDANGVTVHTSIGKGNGSDPINKTFRARKVAITTGAYVNHILSPSFGFKIDLDIWEMVYQYYAMDPCPSGTQFPSMWVQFKKDDDNDGHKSNLFYGFPTVPWGPPDMCRIAVDNAVRRISDPDDRETDPSPYDSDRTTNFVKKHIRGAAAYPNFIGSCLMPNVYDNMFVLDYLPKFVGDGWDNVVVFTAGWAMKFVPIIGQVIKELLLNGETNFDISHFKIDRSSEDGQIIIRQPQDVVDSATSIDEKMYEHARLVLKHKHSGSQNRVLHEISKVESCSREGFTRAKMAKQICHQHETQFYADQVDRPVIEKELKVGILGAGIAGLYAGLILQSLDIEYELLEANNKRAGGRAFTYRFNGEKGKNAEPGTPEYYDYFDVGAMRFPVMKAQDRLIGKQSWSLVEYINNNCDESHKVRLVPYFLRDPKQNSFLDFNGIIATSKVVSKEEKYKDFFRIGCNKGGLVPDEYSTKSYSYWIEKAYRPFLNKLNENFEDGFKMLMKVDTATRAFLNDTFKYPPSLIDWMETRDSATGLYNLSFAENLLLAFDFENVKTTDWKCVDGGTDRFIYAMLSLLKFQPKLGHEVIKISPQGEADTATGVEVTVREHYADGNSKGSSSTYTHVISTLPLAVLRGVDTSDCNFSYGKSTALRVLYYGPSVKIGMRFKSRWWQNGSAPIIGGTSSTDSPVRTIVYPSYGLDCKDAPGVLIASYTWAQDAARLGTMPKDQAVKCCLEALERLHGPIVREEYANDYFVHDWYHDPYSQGAFASFGSGQFATNYPWLLKTELNGLLCFAGEAASAHHGWMVGALNSAYRSVWQILEREHRKDLKKKLIDEWGVVEEVDYHDWTKYAHAKWPDSCDCKSACTMTGNVSKNPH